MSENGSSVTINDASKLRIVHSVDGKEVDITDQVEEQLAKQAKKEGAK